MERQVHILGEPEINAHFLLQCPLYMSNFSKRRVIKLAEKKERMCFFLLISLVSFDLHFLFCVSNHYIETLVNQFKYIIALRQPIQYAKGNALQRLIICWYLKTAYLFYFVAF